jgi:streptogrisin D
MRANPPTGRRVLLGTLVAASVIALPIAFAGTSSADSTVDPTATADLAADLQQRLGTRAAGAYADGSGRLVVNVTDATAATQVRRAGAKARIVARSAAALDAATDVLDRTAAIPGTSWKVDPVTNQVVVEADSTVTGAKRTRLEKAVADLGGAARIDQVAGAVRPEVIGGDAIFMGSSRCSLAFNVLIGGQKHFLTAGHCTNIGATFHAAAGQSQRIGTRVATSFPTNDFGLVRYDAGQNPAGAVSMKDGTTRDISHARNAVVGETVGLSGSTSGLRRGQVTGVDVTVNYSQGPVHGLIQTTICSAGGDSGGAVFAGNAAIGIHSGSSGGCGGSNRAFHQPVTEALSTYGATVY